MNEKINFPKYISCIVIKSIDKNFLEHEHGIGYSVQKDVLKWGERPLGYPKGEGYSRTWGAPEPRIVFYAKNGLFSNYDTKLEDIIEVEGWNTSFNKSRGKKIFGTGEEKHKQILDEVLNYVKNIRSSEDYILHWYETESNVELPEKKELELDYNITPDMLYPVIGYNK